MPFLPHRVRAFGRSDHPQHPSAPLGTPGGKPWALNLPRTSCPLTISPPGASRSKSPIRTMLVGQLARTSAFEADLFLANQEHEITKKIHSLFRRVTRLDSEKNHFRVTRVTRLWPFLHPNECTRTKKPRQNRGYQRPARLGNPLGSYHSTN